MYNRKDVQVWGKQDLSGRIELDDGRPIEERDHIIIQLDGGERISIASDLLVRRTDGSYYLPLSRDELLEMSRKVKQVDDDSIVIPLAEEEVKIGKRKVETGRVRFIKTVEEREEVVAQPTTRERVDVRRITKNEFLENPAEVRDEGETMVIPVMEEVLVVSKRLMLKEEVHVTKRREEARDEKRVTLREEELEVERTSLDRPMQGAE